MMKSASSSLRLGNVVAILFAIGLGLGAGARDARAAVFDSCAPGIDNCGFAATCNDWCRPYSCLSQQCGLYGGTLKCWKCEPTPEQ